jgi:hypothetical protein
MCRAQRATAPETSRLRLWELYIMESLMNRFLIAVLFSLSLFTGCEAVEEPFDGDASGLDVTADVPGDISGEVQEGGVTDVVADPCAELDCDDELECTTDSCDPATGCLNELRAEFCLIDGACAEDGESALDAPCSVCSVEASQEAWTALEEGSVCEDGDLCTTGEVCAAGACAGGSPVTCDDGLLCTADTCEAETGACRFELDADFCVIGDICLASGEYEPGSMCALCSPDESTDSFTPTDGPCDDADPCTLDDICSEGSCTGEALDCGDDLDCAIFTCEEGACVTDLTEGTCAIEGSCYESGESTPENLCASCQPDFEVEAWTSIKDGEPCEDGDLCTAGETCAAGECAGAQPVDCEDGGECTENWCDAESGLCTFTLSKGACVINSLCYETGAINPNNACQICAPAAAVIVWTDSPSGAPCGNGGICVDKECDGSSLAGETCEYAMTVDPESLPTVLQGDNSLYAADYAACSATGTHPDVTYSFTPTVAGTYFFGMPGYTNGVGPSLVGITTDCATLTADSPDPAQCFLAYDFYGSGGAEISASLDADITYFFVVSSAIASEIGTYALSVSEACIPTCEAGVCGGDGCGGQCGCGDGELCVEELCCAPVCDGLACGVDASDGCGQTCGCDDGGVCVEGACCAPVCDNVTCGTETDDSCGGTCGCAEGNLCLEGACCEPVCDATTCGSTADGCGGACSCDEGLFCVLGACSDEPAGQTCDDPSVIDPSNLPITIAGDTTGYSNDYKTCDGFSGLEASDAAYRFTPEASGIYLLGMPGYINLEGASILGVTTDCGGNLLEPSGTPSCLFSHDFFGTTGEEVAVELVADTTYFILIDCYDVNEIGPYTFTVSDLCQPTCDNVSCGEADGCAGVCGCAEDGVCFDGTCCHSVCDGLACGATSDDSCGGQCGCDDVQVCNSGLCCEPVCDGVICGGETDDSCGGTCGCNDSDLCVEGACCAASCEENSCGLGKDGCGGGCECADGLSCANGSCVESSVGDSCDDAIEVGELPFAYLGSTASASDLYNVAAGECPSVASSAGDGAPDQGFLLVAPATGLYTIELDTDWDATLYVTTDCASFVDSCIGGSDILGGGNLGNPESTVVELEEGQVVFIVVDGYNDGDLGLYSLSITEPCIPVCEPGTCGANANGCGGDCGCLANELCILGQCSGDMVGDTCEEPITIDPANLPVVVAGDNTPYTNDYTACGGFNGDEEPDVVYSFTPKVSGVYSFGMPGYINFSGPSLLGITTDCTQVLPGGGAQCLLQKDYYGSAGADVEVELEAGTNYFILIDSYAADEIGAFNFSISGAL